MGGQRNAACAACYPPTRLPAFPPRSPIRHSLRAPSPVAAPDSSKRIKPVSVLWRSLLIPGWGQARTGRNVEGAAFVVFEGVAIMMTARAVQELHYMEASGSVSNVASKRQQIQDWAVLWASIICSQPPRHSSRPT